MCMLCLGKRQLESGHPSAILSTPDAARSRSRNPLHATGSPRRASVIRREQMDKPKVHTLHEGGFIGTTWRTTAPPGARPSYCILGQERLCMLFAFIRSID